MTVGTGFVTDGLSGLRFDQVVLGAGACMLLVMIVYELFGLAAGGLVSGVDPGVAVSTAELELAIAEVPNR